MSKVLAIQVEVPDVVSEQSLSIATAIARQTVLIALQQRGELSVREAAAALGMTYEQYLQLLAEKGLGVSDYQQDPVDFQSLRWKVNTPFERSRSVEMAAIMEQLAALNPFPEIPDPILWQQGVRQDRPLPGRE